LAKPSPQRQQGRLGPRFDRLMQVASSPDDLMALRDDPSSIAPERAIVFELAGSLPDFYAQARALGLEYLGDFESDLAPDEDFYDEKKREKTIAGRIYLAMPDVRALQELLSLWRRYAAGLKLEYGKGAWANLFSLLVDVRPWGPEDRVPAETIAFWQGVLAETPEAPVRFEIELWFYESAERRTAAFARLQAEVEQLGGAVIHHAVIPEIRYDALLVDILPGQVRAIIDHPDITLARVDEVMFLRPQSAAVHRKKEAPEGMDGPEADGAGLPKGEPIAALLDGLPIQNHVRLAGRLVIDDPDDLEPQYSVDSREHGTEMASLIVHGDLNRGELPLPRPLFVMPVLRPDGSGRERTPDNRLLVDVIYRAIRRIKEGDGVQPASAPSVIVINFSICDSFRPFARVMSPLARLLDYLSHRYRVLFLISAGNITDRLAVPPFQTSMEFEGATAEDREKAILSALNANKGQRTLFSPAEALNGLTIGAAHAGSAFNGALPANLIDPFTDEELPNIACAMGLGFRKAVKPELLLEGGRAPVKVVASGSEIRIEPVKTGARLFGAKVAAPNRIGGTRHEDFTWGTSVATALATRGAHLIHDVLTDASGGSNHADIPQDYKALVVKALLVHGASWGPKGEFLDKHFTPQGKGSHFERRDDIARLLGYGVPKIKRVLDCTEHRATMLGTGRITPDSALLYRIPIPAALDGVREFRALTITLAWFSPVNPRHQGYRMAALDVSPRSDEKYWIALDREACQPTDKATERGTVFHERRSCEKAAVFVDNGDLLLRVSCRASAGDFADPVPFALAVSFEVGVESNVQVYDEIRARLAARVPVGASV
jgi:Subtilase family